MATQDVNLVTALSALVDSIDVSRMTKGPVTTLTFTTDLSQEVSCVGYNSLLVWPTSTAGTGTITLTGSEVVAGVHGNCYKADGGAIQTITPPVGKSVQKFNYVSDAIKIARSSSDISACKVQPFNL